MTAVDYLTVENRVVGVAPGGTLSAGGQTTTYPAWSPSYVPTGSTKSYVPDWKTEVNYDPSKGRSFAKAKGAGDILMSPLVRERETVTRSVLAVNCRRSDAAYWRFKYNGQVADRQVPCNSSWTEKYDLSYLSWLGVPVYGEHYQDLEAEISEAIVSTQQSAWSDAISAYDLLSEIGEARETIGFLNDKLKAGANLFLKFKDKDPQAFRRYRATKPVVLKGLADKAAQRFFKRWMEYRYALMPIIYSINDVQKVLGSRGYRFQTDRSSQKIDVTTPLLFAPDNNIPLFLSRCTTGSVIVRSTTKARYDLGSLQRLAATCGFNPFVTAWELTTLSFVADWFMNIGDALQALTGVDLASQRQGCTSVRASIKDQTWATMNRSVDVNRVWYDAGILVSSFASHHVDQASQLVLERSLEAYRRTLWSRPSATLLFDPFLNWKRFMDSAALTYKPTRNIFRSL